MSKRITPETITLGFIHGVRRRELTGAVYGYHLDGGPCALSVHVHMGALPYRARTAVAEELRRQGIRAAEWLPRDQTVIVTVFDDPDYLGDVTYDEWEIQPRSLAQFDTLWPTRPLTRWRGRGMPYREKTKPIPHARRLADLIVSFITCPHGTTEDTWDPFERTQSPSCTHCGAKLYDIVTEEPR